MIPKIYILDRTALKAWEAPTSFNLTFDETVKFIHELQNALLDQRHLSMQSGLEWFILVVPKKPQGEEGQ